jgi:hypothetical protein
MTARNDATADDWGVFVNEAKVNATQLGAAWWAAFTAAHSRSGRITCLAMSITGGHHHVACDSQDGAVVLRDLMTGRGIHPTCTRVARLSACRQQAGRKKSASDARARATAAEVRAWLASPEHLAAVELANEMPADPGEAMAAYTAMGGHAGWEAAIRKRAAQLGAAP